LEKIKIMNLEFGVMPRRIWIENHDADRDACDVIVEMDDGNYYTAAFVTLPFLRRQMELSFEVSKQLPDATALRYAVMDTPHIVVENLCRDVIEDTIDNLLALDTFETVFTLVVDDNEPNVEQRARTAEMTAVVLNEVLTIEDTTVA
jgi:hypothetical protein